MSTINNADKFGIECNIVNERKRFIYLTANEPLKDYDVSVVPCAMSKERATQLIQFIERKREKLSNAELRNFNKKIAYTKLVKF